MNANDMVSVLKGTADVAVNKVKSVIDNDPRKAATYGLLGAGAVTVAHSLITGDAEQISDAFSSAGNAISRTVSLYTPEIIEKTVFATDFLGNTVSDVDYQEIVKDSGVLAGSGIVLKSVYDEVKDNYSVLEPSQKRKLKQGISLLLVAGAISASGCLGGSTSTGVDPVNDPVIPAEKDTPDHTEKPTAEPTAIESQHLYDLNPGYVKIVLEANENLFDIKIEGSMVDGDKAGWETIRDDDKNIIFNRETYNPRNFDLYGELQPGQARALEEQHGSMVSLTMEQIDTDGGGMDKVAVQYVGSKGTWTDTFHFDKRADIEDYIIAHISPEIYPSLIID
ncbi:MAG: hypothetical protein KAS90_01040 [Candidatus Aenigmarchaeota archaeon]|nr:hypothetical protein [Candidatus Aenigmarchaeota archaeon]